MKLSALPLVPPTPKHNLSPQNQRILSYLEGGRTLTPLIAFTTMGIGSITKRISEIKRAGYNIQSEWKQDASGRDYTSYSLSKDAPKSTKKTLSKKELTQ